MANDERRLDLASRPGDDQGELRSIHLAGLDVNYFQYGKANAAHTFVFFAPERGLNGAGTLLRNLARHGRVVAPIYPSFQSDDPALLRSVGDYAYLMLDFIEELDIRNCTLVGSSVGGWIAMELLVRNSERVSRLVLTGAVGVRFGNAKAREIADVFTLTPAEAERLVFHDGDAATDFTQLSDADVLSVARQRQAVARFAWLPYMHNPELARWLHRLRLPTLVIWGENDRMVDTAYGASLAKAIAGAQLHTLEECGHFPHIERASETGEKIIEFSMEEPALVSAIA